MELSRILPCLAVTILAALIGCGGQDSYLDLAWEDFDQNPDGGWRPLADSGDYEGAARMIESYLDHHLDLAPAQRGYSRFHAGQLWALHGDTERALGLIDQAMVEDLPPDFPQSFNALVEGTRCFLRGDMTGARTARDEAAAVHDPGPRDLDFLGALELLADSEGLTYREVYARAIE